jgi:hypothetical protein
MALFDFASMGRELGRQLLSPKRAAPGSRPSSPARTPGSKSGAAFFAESPKAASARATPGSGFARVVLTPSPPGTPRGAGEAEPGAVVLDCDEDPQQAGSAGLIRAEGGKSGDSASLSGRESRASTGSGAQSTSHDDSASDAESEPEEGGDMASDRKGEPEEGGDMASDRKGVSRRMWDAMCSKLSFAFPSSDEAECGESASASYPSCGGSGAGMPTAQPEFVGAAASEHYEMRVAEIQELHARAFESGYLPAVLLLKTMSRADRECIMKRLFIERAQRFNDEAEAFDIALKPIRGLRARTNTALRSLGVLGQSTWVHTLLKAATAMDLNPRMVLSSGDWRLPTRITDNVTHKEALHASCEGFATADAACQSELLSRAEGRFLRKLQRVVEARLGPANADMVADWVIARAGPEHGPVFANYLAKRKSPAKRARAAVRAERKDAKLALKKARKEAAKGGAADASQLALLEPDAPCPMGAGDPAKTPVPVALLESVFANVPLIVANIERVKPGFGRFATLLAQTVALKAAFIETGEFEYVSKSDLFRKMAVVGAKDGCIGLSLGIPLSTFVNPFLGFPLMGMSFINLSIGATELNILEVVAMMMYHQLTLAANGTDLQSMQ